MVINYNANAWFLQDRLHEAGRTEKPHVFELDQCLDFGHTDSGLDFCNHLVSGSTHLWRKTARVLFGTVHKSPFVEEKVRNVLRAS
jgi:hypothetical protein